MRLSNVFFQNLHYIPKNLNPCMQFSISKTYFEKNYASCDKFKKTEAWFPHPHS